MNPTEKPGTNARHRIWVLHHLPPTRWLLLLSSVIMAAAWTLAFSLLSKKALLPSERYDVTTIYVGAVSDVCKGKVSSELRGTELEDCVRELRLENDVLPQGVGAVTIPTLGEILDGARPRFVALLKQQQPDIWKKLVEGREPYVLAFKLPAELFTIRSATHHYQSLVFSQADSALFCVEASCRTPADRIAYGAQDVPLLVDALPQGKYGSVWAIGKSTMPWAFAISLADGIFVVRKEALLPARLFYSTVLNLDRIQYSFVFAGVFLLVLWFAWTWHRFIDLGCFALLAAWLAGMGIYYALAPLLTVGPFMAPSIRFVIMLTIWSGLLGIMMAFAQATVRASARRTALTGILGVGLACVATLALGWAGAYTPSMLETAHVDIAVGILAFLCPPFIAYRGGWNFHKELRQLCRHGSAPARSDLEIARRRRLQQILFGILLQVLTLQMFVNALLCLQQENVQPVFSASSAVSFLLLFLTLMSPVMQRLAKALQLNPGATEATRLKLLLDPAKFRAWKQKSRMGLFLDLDLKGSSIATRALKQSMLSLMKDLKSAVVEDLRNHGVPVLLTKPMGDSRILVVELPLNDAAGRAGRVLSLLARRLPAYVGVVQTAQAQYASRQHLQITDEERLGLHARVYIVTSFWLHGEDEPGSHVPDEDEDLDFISEELNHQMKYASKPPSGAVYVSGPDAIVRAAWEVGAVAPSISDLEPLATIMQQSSKPIDMAIAAAKALNLVYGFINVEDHSESVDRENAKRAG